MEKKKKKVIKVLYHYPYQTGQLIYFSGTLKVKVVIYLMEKIISRTVFSPSRSLFQP